MTRRAVLLAAAIAVVASSFGGLLAGSPFRAPAAAAASTGLTLTADARYAVDPAKHRVRVAVRLAAMNHRSDTKTHRYYYDRTYLAVQPGTRNFKIASAGANPSVHVSKRTSTYTLLRIDFGKRLGSGQARRFGLTFELPDPGGAATRTTRIGASLVSFGVWGLGAAGSPGGSVTVVFPKGYQVEVDAAGLKAPTTDSAGDIIYTTGALANPLTFFAYFVADRPSAYRETTFGVRVGGQTVPIAIRAWPDDPSWAARVRDVLTRGLPVLAEDIGLPWTLEQPLVVSEALSRTSAGFSGRFDPSAGQIDVAYYASPLVVLHEAAHAWFNGTLLADRWANEGFATWYAVRAARTLKIPRAAAPKLTPALQAVRVPLNAWPAPDGSNARLDDAEYAASYQLAAAAGTRATPAGLQAVWQAIHDGRATYQPTGTRASLETGDTPPDWRGLLDLLEDRTPATYTDLWTDWVVRPSETGLLDARAAARAAYAATVDRAGAWLLPRVVRDAMRVWRYDQAGDLLTSATTALEDREAVATAARQSGLTAPATMQLEFEGPRGFAAASAEAEAELAAIAAYDDARASRPADPSLVDRIGLWNSDPAGALDGAAAAFAAGDLRATVESAGFAKRIWTTSGEVGRNRIVAVVLVTSALVLGLWLTIRWYRDRRRARRRRRRPMFAHRTAAPD